MSQLLSSNSPCDSLSCFSSSLPWLSSQNADGSLLKSRQKSLRRNQGRSRGRSQHDRPNQESQDRRQANRNLQPSTMQSGLQHLLVAHAGGIWPGLCHLQERAAPELKGTL